MDNLDRFRKIAGDITQRFAALQRAEAAGDQVGIQAAVLLMANLQSALHSAPRYAVGDFLFTTRIEADVFAEQHGGVTRDIVNDH